MLKSKQTLGEDKRMKESYTVSNVAAFGYRT